MAMGSVIVLSSVQFGRFPSWWVRHSPGATAATDIKAQAAKENVALQDRRAAFALRSVGHELYLRREQKNRPAHRSRPVRCAGFATALCLRLSDDPMPSRPPQGAATTTGGAADGIH